MITIADCTTLERILVDVAGGDAEIAQAIAEAARASAELSAWRDAPPGRHEGYKETRLERRLYYRLGEARRAVRQYRENMLSCASRELLEEQAAERRAELAFNGEAPEPRATRLEEPPCP